MKHNKAETIKMAGQLSPEANYIIQKKIKACIT